MATPNAPLPVSLRRCSRGGDPPSTPLVGIAAEGDFHVALVVVLAVVALFGKAHAAEVALGAGPECAARAVGWLMVYTSQRGPDRSSLGVRPRRSHLPLSRDGG